MAYGWSEMRFWIDDERDAPDDSWSVSRTSREAIKRIGIAAHYSARLEEVSLDHDLGGDDTGFIVLDWIVEHKVWPEELTIHTSNRPARERMLATANVEAPEWVKISVIYDHLRKQ